MIVVDETMSRKLREDVKFIGEGDELTRKPRLLHGTKQDRAVSALILETSRFSVKRRKLIQLSHTVGYAFIAGPNDLMGLRKFSENEVIDAKWSSFPNRPRIHSLHHKLLQRSA